MSPDVELLAVAPAPSPPPAVADAAASVPLTVEQRDRWLACQFDPPDAPARVDLWEIAFSGPIQRALLAAAVQETCSRHDALRIRYLSDGSGQLVEAAQDSSVARVRDLPNEDNEAAILAGIQAEAGRTFNRERGPLAGWWWQGGHGGGRLVFAAHQLVMDPPSAFALLRDVAANYHKAAGVDRAAEAAHAASSFLAYAREETGRAHVAVLAADYWRERLATPAEPLELPLDRPRPATPTYRGGEVRRDYPGELASAWREFARYEGVALADLFIAGWGALLHRLAESERFLIGVAVENRSALVGPLLRLRPLIVSVARSTTFREHLQATAREHAAIVQHVEADVGSIARELHWLRDSARPWLFAITFATESPPAILSFEGVAGRVAHLAAPHLEGDLALTLVDSGDSLTVRCRFNADSFTAATVQRWLGHLATLLTAAVRAPHTTVGRLDLLTLAERHQLITAPGGHERDAGSPTLLHALFTASATRRPEHAAVIADGERMSYADLDARANGVAHQLRARGCGPGHRVALLLDRSAEYAVATLAVLKSGAAFVPIDPEWPAERQELVLLDCGACILITAGRSPSGEPPAHLHVLDLRTAALQRASTPPDGRVDAEDLAYIIYTSGSTGVPKGVMIDHRAAATHMASIAQVYRLAPDDCSLLFHSVAFDPAIEQLFAPWVVGATVYIRGEGLWTGREFSAWVEREGITAVTLPPLYWLQLLRDWELEPGLAPVGRLRRVLVGGEALPPTVVDLWRRLGLTSIRLLNGYGPTECTVTATVHELPAKPAENEATGRIPIGRPQGPVEAYVVDAALQPQPIGVLGELCLAGPTLARGYLGRDALTQERFIPHPFRPGARMYRTGDRARVLADGTIDFCGRADRQVKVGGYRIEPGEIESALGRVDGVGAAAVVVERGARSESLLVAYVVPVEGRILHHANLRAELSVSLPRYMVPTRFVDVAALPRTINGKLDEEALRRLGVAAQERERETAIREDPRGSIAVRDELETRVADIWCAALGRTEVTPADDFFDQGGHSLIAVGMYARLERELGVRVALREWLVHPTFAALVRLVRGEPGVQAGDRPGSAWKFLFPINAHGDRPRLFLFAGGRGCDEDFVVLAALTRALGADQPVWGLRLGGPDRLRAIHGNAVEMAADVAREIRQFQPEGPYHLAGECIGGLLAYEVARIFEREGAPVAFLGMVNTGCPRFAESFRWWLRTTWVGRAKQTLRPLLAALRQSSWNDVPGHLRVAAGKIWRSPFAGRPPRADGMPEDPKDYHYGKMLLRYRPSPTRLPMVLFACETFKRAINQQRWARHARTGVRLVPLLGDTTTCIREHARDSALKLRSELVAR